MVLTRSANKQQENGTLDMGRKQQQPKINHFFKQHRNENESDGDEDDGNNPSRKRLMHSSNSVRTRRSAAVAANFAIQEQTPRRVLVSYLILHRSVTCRAGLGERPPCKKGSHIKYFCHFFRDFVN